MASPGPALAAVLRSPPAMRSALVRTAVAAGVTRCVASTPSRLSSPKAHGYTADSRLARDYLRWRGFHSTPSFFNSAPASASLHPDAAAQPPPPTPAPSRLRRLLTATSLILVFFSAGFIMTTGPSADAINGYLHPPSDAESLRLFSPATQTAAEINDYMVNHPLVQKLRQQEGIVESRPHLKIPEAMRSHNFTIGTLVAEGKLEVPPLVLQNRSLPLPSMTQIIYVGPDLCGYPGQVHGGLLATLLDEGLARACFAALPNKVGVTANLNINYRSPCPADSYLVLRAETVKVDGRKAWVKGWIELLGDEDGMGTKVAEADALFIEPKGAKNMAPVVAAAS